MQNEIKSKAWENLQTIQHHTIINNQLNYHLDGHLSLQLLCQQRYIKNFSFGQLILIIQGIQIHLIKVYQKMNITQLLLENIYFNNKLKVKFINLHEIEGELSYDKNHQKFVVIVHNIFLAYQKYYITFQASTNNQQQNKIIEKLTFVSNEVLKSLKSKRHHLKLKIFIKQNIANQELNGQFINDKIIDPLEFRKLFDIHQSDIHQSKAQNLNLDGNQDEKPDFSFSNQPSSKSSRVPSDSEEEKQLQHQNNPCQVNNFNLNVEIDTKQLIEYGDEYQLKEVGEVQQDENNNQNNQKQSEIHSNDDSDQNNKSFISRLFSQDENIQEINDYSFKEKLERFLSEQYVEVDEQKSKQLFLCSKIYYNQYQIFINKQQINQDENQNEMNQKFLEDLRQNYLEFLLKNDKKVLFDSEIDDGTKICQKQLDNWTRKFFKYQQKQQQKAVNQ